MKTVDTSGSAPLPATPGKGRRTRKEMESPKDKQGADKKKKTEGPEMPSMREESSQEEDDVIVLKEYTKTENREPLEISPEPYWIEEGIEPYDDFDWETHCVAADDAIRNINNIRHKMRLPHGVQSVEFKLAITQLAKVFGSINTIAEEQNTEKESLKTQIQELKIINKQQAMELNRIKIENEAKLK